MSQGLTPEDTLAKKNNNKATTLTDNSNGKDTEVSKDCNFFFFPGSLGAHGTICTVVACTNQRGVR